MINAAIPVVKPTIEGKNPKINKTLVMFYALWGNFKTKQPKRKRKKNTTSQKTDL